MDDWVAETLDTTTDALSDLHSALTAWHDDGDTSPLPDTPAARDLSLLLGQIEAMEQRIELFRGRFAEPAPTK